jgi:hypothetical protein
MSQVKLIVIEGYGSEQRPYKTETGKVIDLGVRVPDTHDILAVVRTDFDVEADGSKRSNDAIDPVIRYERINDLVGKLLTLVDSMFSDPKQRKAAKDLFKQVAWDWYNAQTDLTVTEIWRKDKFPKTAAMQKQEFEEVFGTVDAE